MPFEQEDRGDAEAQAIPAGANHVLLEFEYRGPADPPLPNRHPPANTYKDVHPAAYDMTWKYGGYGGAPGPPMGFDVFTADDEGNTGQKVVSRRGPGKDTEPYAGTLLVAAGEARRVIVISDGAWSMRMAPVSTARTMAATTKGVGDDVVLYLGEAAEWRVSGDADLRLRVFDLSGAEVQDLSVPVASVGPGPSIVQVVADGAWEIGVQDGR